MTAVFRQGDVILVSVQSIPAEAKKQPSDNGRTVLAYGEVTGHAHALPMQTATQYKVGTNGKEFLEVKKPTQLRHEEHAPIDLPKGLYEKRIAREYTPGGERQVVD